MNIYTIFRDGSYYSALQLGRTSLNPPPRLVLKVGGGLQDWDIYTQ